MPFVDLTLFKNMKKKRWGFMPIVDLTLYKNMKKKNGVSCQLWI